MRDWTKPPMGREYAVRMHERYSSETEEWRAKGRTPRPLPSIQELAELSITVGSRICSRRTQGFPDQIEDPAELDWAAALLRGDIDG